MKDERPAHNRLFMADSFPTKYIYDIPQPIIDTLLAMDMIYAGSYSWHPYNRHKGQKAAIFALARKMKEEWNSEGAKEQQDINPHPK